MSNYHVGVRDKSTYVGGGIRGIEKGEGSSADAMTKEKAPNVELYAERWEQGRDIWTGEKLRGSGLADWQGQQKSHKRFSNRDMQKRRRVKIAIKKVGDTRKDVKAYCEEHHKFSPSSNLISEIVTEIKYEQLE